MSAESRAYLGSAFEWTLAADLLIELVKEDRENCVVLAKKH
jgi:hypothetical protein